jgi:hypothetical protein
MKSTNTVVRSGLSPAVTPMSYSIAQLNSLQPAQTQMRAPVQARLPDQIRPLNPATSLIVTAPDISNTALAASPVVRTRSALHPGSTIPAPRIDRASADDHIGSWTGMLANARKMAARFPAEDEIFLMSGLDIG